MKNYINALYECIQQSENIVFFGGAGVSTESGIPDFRSKDGLYNQHDINFDKYNPEYLLSKTCLEENPEVFYEFYRQKMDFRNVTPNITHYTLAKLENQGKLKAIITQNVDGLHQKAGSKNVIELHGNIRRNYCHWCGKEYSSDYIFSSNEKIPKCYCDGNIRPDMTLYEEKIPDKARVEAIKQIENADMLIIVGTSLSVYPACSFIYEFKGAYLFVINKDEIKISSFIPGLHYIIQDSLGKVFTELNKLM